MTIIEPERLLIQSWQPEDWRDFRYIATDPEVMRYISDGKPWSDERIQRFVTRQINNQKRHGFCLWKLTDRTNNRLIGFCGIQPLGSTGEVEIGWWLARNCWGLATEAARCVLCYGFETCHLNRAVVIAHPDNQASYNLMRKLGMTFEKNPSTDELGLSPPGLGLALYSVARPKE